VPRTKFVSHLLFLRLSPSDDGAVNSCNTTYAATIPSSAF